MKWACWKSYLIWGYLFALTAGLTRATLIAKESNAPSYFGVPAPDQPSGPGWDRTKNTALVPMAKLEEAGFDWLQRHQDILALEKTTRPKIVLIGDSIIHFWGGLPEGHIQNGPESWQKTFGNRAVLNLGFAWDRTQNVLWRLDHGEFDTIRPKTAVVNIGMNNFIATASARSNSPQEVAQAIIAICDRIRAKSFQTRIIVMGVFPRGQDAASEARAPINALNVLLAKAFFGRTGIIFLDIGKQLLNPDGSLNQELMLDETHPSEKGYEVWGKALQQAGALSE